MSIFLPYNLDVLSSIDSASEFEKILTNKYELLTIITTLKIGDYALPPLIKAAPISDTLLYMHDIKNNLQFNGKITIIFINCYSQNFNQEYYHFFNNLQTYIIHIDDTIKKSNFEKNTIYTNSNFNIKDKNIQNFINNSNNIYIFYKDSITNTDEKITIEDSILIKIFIICSLYMPIHGNIYYKLEKFQSNDEILRLLNIIAKQFEKLIYYDNIVSCYEFGFIQFLNKRKDNKIQKIILNLSSENLIDLNKRKTIGGNITLYIEDVDDSNKLINNKYINVKLPPINKKFLKFMLSIYEQKIKELNKKYDEILFVRKNYKKIMDDIHPYITTLILNGIEFCDKNNIAINEYYLDFKPLNYKSFIEKYFKRINDVNLNNVKISIDSNYSITLPYITERMAKYIKKEMPSVEYIIDGTANIGSTGVVLSLYFKHIYSVELIKTTYDILVHNINEYKIKNITTFNDSIISFMHNIKIKCPKYNSGQYCLFLDPPWTGVFYKTEKTINLFLDNINIIDFIKRLKNIKYICLKVPFNYNFSHLYREFSNITIHKVIGFYFVLIQL
jgi:hypothetical protein